MSLPVEVSRISIVRELLPSPGITVLSHKRFLIYFALGVRGRYSSKNLALTMNATRISPKRFRVEPSGAWAASCSQKSWECRS